MRHKYTLSKKTKQNEASDLFWWIFFSFGFYDILCYESTFKEVSRHKHDPSCNQHKSHNLFCIMWNVQFVLVLVFIVLYGMMIIFGDDVSTHCTAEYSDCSFSITLRCSKVIQKRIYFFSFFIPITMNTCCTYRGQLGGGKPLFITPWKHYELCVDSEWNNYFEPFEWPKAYCIHQNEIGIISQY